MSERTPLPPDEPDILIQDLEDVPASSAPRPDESGSRCARCDADVPEGADYCDACLQTMRAYPVAAGAWIGAILAVLIGLFGLFMLCVNLLIVRPIIQGDTALAQGDLRACYAGYAESYSVAERLNTLLFADSDLTFFTNGARTLEKQILALDRLNGPYQAGRVIETYYGKNPPKALRSIYGQYQGITAFVTEMQTRISAYKESLGAGETGDYETMLALVDEAAEKLPQTPEYMVQYYRFSVSYSFKDDPANNDPARTCELLDELIAMQPDALWLYASEGIRAYNLNGSYEKALAICNALMQSDASDPASIAYTMQELRLLQEFDNAIEIYDRGCKLTDPSSEMQRQYAIILMLQGDYASAQKILVASYSPSTASLDHVATIALCAFANGDDALYMEYKSLLDSYMPYKQVDLFASGACTLEEIFLSGGGEVV